MSLDCLSVSLQVFGPMQFLIFSHFVGLGPLGSLWQVGCPPRYVRGIGPDKHYVILRAPLVLKDPSLAGQPVRLLSYEVRSEAALQLSSIIKKKKVVQLSGEWAGLVTTSLW